MQTVNYNTCLPRAMAEPRAQGRATRSRALLDQHQAEATRAPGRDRTRTAPAGGTSLCPARPSSRTTWADTYRAP